MYSLVRVVVLLKVDKKTVPRDNFSVARRDASLPGGTHHWSFSVCHLSCLFLMSKSVIPEACRLSSQSLDVNTDLFASF